MGSTRVPGPAAGCNRACVAAALQRGRQPPPPRGAHRGGPRAPVGGRRARGRRGGDPGWPRCGRPLGGAEGVRLPRTRVTPPRLTVVVCTRHRAGPLEACLASLAAQTLAPGDLEVIVVDNGSTDATSSVAARWLGGDLHGRCVRESRVGLSHARNTGVAAATADVVAFLDDDARA